MFGPPKSRRTVHDVPLSAAAIAALRRQRARQAEERLAAGKGWQDHGLVFTRPNGRPVDTSEVGRALHRALDRAGLPPCRLHDLRHGTASLLIGAGVPLVTVSRVLGHSTAQFTLDVYGHLTPEVQREAEHAMDRLFGTA